MDYGEQNNFTNETFNPDADMAIYANFETSARFIINELVQIIVLLSGITADGLIIYTLTKFSRLQKKTVNMFILNVAIADLLFLAVNPSFFNLLYYLIGDIVYAYLYCTLSELMMGFDTVVLIFLYLLTIDWCLAQWWPQVSAKLRRHYKTIIAGVWLFCGVFAVMYIVLCHYGFYIPYSGIVLFFGFGGFFLFVLVLHIVRAIRKCSGRVDEESLFVLVFTTGVVGCYVMGFLGLLFHAFFFTHYECVVFSICLMYSSGLVNLIVLNKMNKDFQACFKQVLQFSKYIDSTNKFEDDEDSEAPVIGHEEDNGIVTEVVTEHNK